MYVHIDRLGHNDNIGERTAEQIMVSENVKPAAFDDTINNRGEESPVRELNLPKRNLFVQFKAFPKLEQLKTGTVWQKDEKSEFNYRSQFPVLMSPDSLEKLEKFIMVLELWDQISPSVQEFLGIVKIPLSPICYAMKTTDDEIYSLNFLADQFCMYPMTVCDGFLPVYSPKLGQNIAHLKVLIAIGSPV